MNSLFSGVDWTCPAREQRGYITELTEQTIQMLSDTRNTLSFAETVSSARGEKEIVLPIWQNLESLVYARRICEKKHIPLQSGYCVSTLDEMDELSYDLASDPMIQTVLSVIKVRMGNAVVLEIESPFSVLGALMDPISLYGINMDSDDGRKLRGILRRIALAETEYILAAQKSGCSVFSLADPIGTMDMTGADFYAAICGPSEAALLHQIVQDASGIVIHVCRKMSLSLVLSGLAEASEIEIERDVSFYDALNSAQKMDSVIFAGFSCMHGDCPSVRQIKQINLKYK